ncbi:MAG: hypothetical protein QOD29_2229, partial [Alphaproteobacteria bacterium]|nr:hypothetical protein [Alphaproteobacteria bacterium]
TPSEWRADLDIEGARSRRSGLNPPHGKNRRGLLNSTVAERRVHERHQAFVVVLLSAAVSEAAGAVADGEAGAVSLARAANFVFCTLINSR